MQNTLTYSPRSALRAQVIIVNVLIMNYSAILQRLQVASSNITRLHNMTALLGMTRPLLLDPS